MVVEDQESPVSGVDIDGGGNAERAKVSDVDEHVLPPVVALHAFHHFVDLFAPDSVDTHAGDHHYQSADEEERKAQNERGPVVYVVESLVACHAAPSNSSGVTPALNLATLSRSTRAFLRASLIDCPARMNNG